MKNKAGTKYLRVSIIILILPILYIGLWATISGDQSMTYNEQVMTLMGYFPEFARNPFWITVTFFLMSFASAVLSFRIWLKSIRKGLQITAMMVCALAKLLSIWFATVLL